MIKILVIVTLALVFEASAQSNFGPCVNPNKKQATCIYVKECASLIALIQKKPLSHENRVFLSKSQCGYQNGQPLVCCAAPDAPPALPTKPPAPSNLLPKPGGGVCGSTLQDKIYGGERAKITDFPWMVLLQYSKPNNRKGFHCGGVLINDQYVLTASHCVNGKDLPATWTLSGVRLGEWDTLQENDCDDSNLGEDPICSLPPLDIPISEKIPHEDYNPQSRHQYNDIALLRLSQKVKYNQYIKPICLPDSPSVKSRDLTGVQMEVAGWGKTENASTSNYKLKVNVDGVSLDSCNGVYAREGVTLKNGQICAGGVKGQDSCRGDSGGPLMTVDDTTDPIRPYYYLAGLVSFGPSPCGMEGWPGVYTKVSDYTEWVKSKLQA